MARLKRASRPVEFAALLRAPSAALQWRLLLLWVLLLLIPTAVVSLPLWSALGGLLDHSAHAPAWADGFDVLMAGDVMAQLAQGGGLGGAALAGLLITVLLLPLLNGMIVAGARAGRALGFGHLLQSGTMEYGRMFRLLLWSVLPYAIALGIGAAVMFAAQRHAETAVLQSSADAARHAAQWLLVALVVLAQVWLESARSAFVADAGLRSATRAFGRGFMQLLRRPLSSLLSYLLISLLGVLLLTLFGVGRIHVPAVGLGGFLLALLLTELGVAAVGWMHAARIHALSNVALSLRPARRTAGLSPAL